MDLLSVDLALLPYLGQCPSRLLLDVDFLLKDAQVLDDPH
jgi:hypothetical protein